MSRYTVTAERSGRWWVLQAVDAPGAISQVSRLDQAGQIIEAIAFVTGEASAEIQIAVTPVVPESVREHQRRAVELREAAQAASSRAAEEHRAAAKELEAAGLTVRDIGAVLGVSFQRAHQLVRAA
ncbi:MAG TPA: hypothetical protein VFU07_00555 [Candidatus Lumbricidophila sp.]|nr:hypothetical protein [Candidatus Lumbricidophila sp.]